MTEHNTYYSISFHSNRSLTTLVLGPDLVAVAALEPAVIALISAAVAAPTFPHTVVAGLVVSWIIDTAQTVDETAIAPDVDDCIAACTAGPVEDVQVTVAFAAHVL